MGSLGRSRLGRPRVLTFGEDRADPWLCGSEMTARIEVDARPAGTPNRQTRLSLRPLRDRHKQEGSDSPMGRTTLLLAGLALGRWFAVEPRADDATPAKKPDPALVEFFEGKVRPVLEAHCIHCHGPAKQKAGLRLDSRAALIKGGDSGPTIEPGRPEGSRLIEAVNHSLDLQMPPKGKLKAAEVEALARWVRDGAVWPEATAEVRPACRRWRAGKIDHRPRTEPSGRSDPVEPTRRSRPSRTPSWPKGPIDRFVLGCDRGEGATPGRAGRPPGADPPGDFDLIGLPPTPEEVEAFVGRRGARRVREGRRPAPGQPPLRRAVGPALARRRPLRRGPGAHVRGPDVP